MRISISKERNDQSRRSLLQFDFMGKGNLPIMQQRRQPLRTPRDQINPRRQCRNSKETNPLESRRVQQKTQGGRMKRKDIKPCMFCKQGIAHSGFNFYEIKLTQHVLDMQEIQRETGLENFFGGGQQGATLASVMGTDPDLTNDLKTVKGLVCSECALTHNIAQTLETEE